MELFKNTFIWTKTIGIATDNEHSSQIEELRVAYLKLRENASILVTRISATIPALTQHEISHLDSLWDTASLIVGENFPINPLEGFILGSAILIHDSALCFEAYENGQEGVRETLQWKDAFADLCDSNEKADREELKGEADFMALRQLHALQAESLLGKNWIDPDTHQEIYLLENQALRKHFGRLIGQIAGSHHWDIENLVSKLSSQQNTLPNFPREWRIDPIKLACILRCADAAHIDNKRAPDFLYALIKRSGVSFNHWQSQNRLAKVDIDQSDPKKETLLFTSTFDFNENEAESWFVAYDAACLVDKEIKSCNSLLESRNPDTLFKIKNVKGVDSPENLSKYIKSSGWQPCSAQVHVGNIEKLIHNLGGEMLYGTSSDLIGIGIRELIQNARDAVNARHFVESNFEGRINIKIQNIEGNLWLTIEDNGIGMSERVLTGPLLDFGTSFWTSSLIKSEFPGLRSSSFKSIGKFGIGFYAVFMIADQVFVASKNWDKGLSDTNLLKFKNGFSLRPIITKGKVEDFSSSISTQIKIQLKPGLIPADLMMDIKTNKMGSKNFKAPFGKYLAAISAGLDVPIYFTMHSEAEVKIHENIRNKNLDKKKWLNDISFSEYQLEETLKGYISKNINRLKPIKEGNQIFGLAAISTILPTSQNFLSISTVGGLAHSVHTRDGDKYIGFIDHQPRSAKREGGDFSANEYTIKQWAENQLNELLGLNLNPFERYTAASALCHFKIDPTELASILISFNGKKAFHTIDQMAELSKTVGIGFLESGFGGHMETNNIIFDLPDYALVIPLSNNSFLSLKTDGDIPQNNNSIIDCTYRRIIKKGGIPQLSKIENVAKNAFKQNLSLIVLTSQENS